MTKYPVRILYIDLSSQRSEVKVHEDLSQWLGGVGVTTSVLSENLEEAPFVLARGPFCDLFPGCARTFASFISPLSRNLGEGQVGGNLGVNLLRAGLEGIVVLGKSKTPVVLQVKNDEVEFVASEELWGKGLSQATKELLDAEGLEGASVLAIGPAAEKGVRFGNVLVDKNHYFGMGLGAVWGRIKLKGMLISGSHEVSKPESAKFEKSRQDLEEDFSDPSPEGLKFRIRERPKRIWELLEKSGCLGGKNFREKVFLKVKFVQDFFDGVGLRRCHDCPLECPSCSCETLASLGPLLGLEEKEEILSLLSLACDLGLDPSSLGASLAWLIEKEGWEFGDLESYKSLTSALAEREEDWAKELSLGLSRAVGSKDKSFAFIFSGVLGLPFFSGYLTVLSRLLSSSISPADACLLDFSLSEEELSDEERVRILIQEEKKNLLLLSLSGCPYLSRVYNLPTIFSGLESVDIGFSHEELENLSDAIYNLRWEIRKQLGFSWDEINIPERIFEVKSATGNLEEGRLRRMLDIYRGSIRRNEQNL